MDERTFREAIIAEPDNIGLRLAYADWLEDTGDTEQSEFIRSQNELADLEEGDWRKEVIAGRWGLDNDCLARRGERISELRKKQMEALDRNFLKWVMVGSVNRHIAAAISANSRDRVCMLGRDRGFYRGLLEHIGCPATLWTFTAGEICFNHPIQLVTHPDRRPTNDFNQDHLWEWTPMPYSWSEPYMIPACIVPDGAVLRFLGEVAAIEALSMWSLAYGRKKADELRERIHSS